MSFIYTPGTKGIPNWTKPGIFLGGSIEMGKAVDWQTQAAKRFNLDEINVFNPRWAGFEPTADQSVDNPTFVHQVNWELSMIERADCVLMVLLKDTKSPISLLEIGLISGMNSQGAINKMVICCPREFWRKGNVDVVAQRYKIPLFESGDDLFEEAEAIMLRNWERRVEPKIDLNFPYPGSVIR